MAYKSDSYTPNNEGRRILAAAWDFVQAVPYKVTTRWLFYQLLQAGFYRGKDDYKNKCVPLLSRARHNEFMGWRPDSLVDDRREANDRTGGFETVADWVNYLAAGGWACDLDHFYNQDFYLELWFEAEAMSRQFEYYTQGVTLRPFSGMPSISYKWTIAKELEGLAERYSKPIVILYFGDYDLAGMTIPETSINDIRGWCNVDFEVIRCGLNEGDAERYKIPENIDKPGSYQWEALSDATAKELITGSVKRFINPALIDARRREGWQAARILDKYFAGFSDYYTMATNQGG
jgi:hypothetical protein